jgi:hypothetical protein
VKSEFKNELVKQWYYFEKSLAGYYSIRPQNRVVRPKSVQLVISRPINQIIHGSQNGNELDGIGYFLFRLNSEINPDYIVFVFRHLINESAQFMIIPTEELKRRLRKNIIRYRNGEFLELRLWLMESNLYDTTTIFLQAELFYFMGNRKGSRKIDGTIWNYTRFLNNWVLGSRE